MPVTLLDLIVIGVILISALLAMVRGFTREVLSIAAWVAAAAAALFLHPYLLPYLTPYIQKELFAQLAAGSIIFLVTLIVVSFITIRISDMILDSRIGALDRTLGFLFGAARGLLLAVVAFLFFSWVVSVDKQPTWVTGARSNPILKSGGTWLLSILPTDFMKTIAKRLDENGILQQDAAPQGAAPDENASPTQKPPVSPPATPPASPPSTTTP